MAIEHFSQSGIEYFQLFIPCPSCIEKGKPTQPSYWTHSECGGDLYVGENAFYYCKKCGHTRPVMLWKYSCPNHPDGEYYSISDGKYLLNAMTVAGEITKGPGGIKFMRRFSANLDDWVTNNPRT